MKKNINFILILIITSIFLFGCNKKNELDNSKDIKTAIDNFMENPEYESKIDKDLLYLIKYPKSWNAHKEDKLTLAIRFPENFKTYGGFFIKVIPFDEKLELTLDKYVNNVIEDYSSNLEGFSLESISSKKLLDYEAKVITYELEKSKHSKIQTTVFIKDTTIHVFQYGTDIIYFDIIKPAIDKIFENLRLIKIEE